VFYHYAQGAAHAANGNARAAEQEAKNLASITFAPDEMISLVNPVTAVIEVARDDLAGRVALARKDTRAAIAAFTRAVAAEDKLAYNEPPDWLLPERERLGAALLLGGRPEEAEKVFRDDLERNRQNPRSLFGLWKTLERRGKTAEAVEARKLFEAAWHDPRTTLRMDAR
jgi:tetratricopeptide (TPR) repeat protein